MKISSFKAVFLASFIFVSTSASAIEKCKSDTCKAVVGVSKTSGYCARHNPNANHCHGTTKQGQPCKQLVKKGENHCRFHKI